MNLVHNKWICGILVASFWPYETDQPKSETSIKWAMLKNFEPRPEET